MCGKKKGKGERPPTAERTGTDSWRCLSCSWHPDGTLHEACEDCTDALSPASCPNCEAANARTEEAVARADASKAAYEHVCGVFALDGIIVGAEAMANVLRARLNRQQERAELLMIALQEINRRTYERGLSQERLRDIGKISNAALKTDKE